MWKIHLPRRCATNELSGMGERAWVGSERKSDRTVLNTAFGRQGSKRINFRTERVMAVSVKEMRSKRPWINWFSPGIRYLKCRWIRLSFLWDFASSSFGRVSFRFVDFLLLFFYGRWINLFSLQLFLERVHRLSLMRIQKTRIFHITCPQSPLP